ncbi:MAG: multidrug efflux MFS transporter [Acidimicrobiales bacterium]|nr:multidrug efflux MFS transporter [Acidimicrobiales bacterium]
MSEAALTEPVPAWNGPVPERAAWRALAVIMGATIMVALDTTIVNVALHQIGVDLGAGDGIEWVVTAYLLAACVAQPVTGWMSSRFGSRPVFLFALTVFTAASVACAISPSLPFLVGARVLQGLGGGALMPVGMAMVLDLFPKERHGRTVAIWGMATMVAPAVGPTVGGWLVTSVSWHWMFLINLPVGLLTLAAALRFLPTVGHRSRASLDTTGLLLGSGGLSIAILGLSQANSWGWASPATIGCIGLGLLALAAFVRHELSTPAPMIELRMFENRSFRTAMAVMLFLYIAQYGRLVYLPLQLEGLRGETALAVGLLFMPAGVCTAVAMSIGGRLVDARGPRLPVMVGCAVMFVSMTGFSLLTLTTPMLLIAVLMSIQGVGFGMVMAPAMVAGLSDLPPHLIGQGSAVRSLLGQCAGALSVAFLGAVVSGAAGGSPTVQQSQDAYNLAFTVATACIAVGFLLARRLPDHVERPDGELLAEAELLAVAE